MLPHQAILRYMFFVINHHNMNLSAQWTLLPTENLSLGTFPRKCLHHIRHSLSAYMSHELAELQSLHHKMGVKSN